MPSNFFMLKSTEYDLSTAHTTYRFNSTEYEISITHKTTDV